VEKTGKKRPWKSLRDFHFSHSFNNNKLDDRDHFQQNAKTSVASLRGLIGSSRNIDRHHSGMLIGFTGIPSSQGDPIDAVGSQIFFDAAVPHRKVTRSPCIAVNAWFVLIGHVPYQDFNCSVSFYKGESQEKNLPSDWKEQRFLPGSPAHVMLRVSGGSLFSQVHLVIVTTLSASDANKQCGCKVPTMVLSETLWPIAFSGCARGHMVYQETGGARSTLSA
jgi:hypothetical protein